MVTVSPTVRQRELGIRLRELRNARSLTVEGVAGRLACSATKISRAGTGSRQPTLRDVRDLCGFYEVDEGTAAELMELARQAREPGWWTRYDDLKITPFIGMEQEATAITCFGMYFMPALMQTEDYAREMIKGGLWTRSGKPSLAHPADLQRRRDRGFTADSLGFCMPTMRSDHTGGSAVPDLGGVLDSILTDGLQWHPSDHPGQGNPRTRFLTRRQARRPGGLRFSQPCRCSSVGRAAVL